jgi:hypothetical protein
MAAEGDGRGDGASDNELIRRAIHRMTEIIYFVSGSQGQWELCEAKTKTTVGHVNQKGPQFYIAPTPGSILDSIYRGPYLTSQEAFFTVGTHVKGSCRLVA